MQRLSYGWGSENSAATHSGRHDVETQSSTVLRIGAVRRDARRWVEDRDLFQYRLAIPVRNSLVKGVGMRLRLFLPREVEMASGTDTIGGLLSVTTLALLHRAHRLFHHYVFLSRLSCCDALSGA